jgi:hypothetical protein
MGGRGKGNGNGPEAVIRSGEAAMVLRLLLLLASEGAGEGVEGGVVEATLSPSSSRPRMLWMEKDFFLPGSGD